MRKFLGLKRKVSEEEDASTTSSELSVRPVKQKPFRPPLSVNNQSQGPESRIRGQNFVKENQNLKCVTNERGVADENAHINTRKDEEGRYFSVLYCKRKRGGKAKGPWLDGVATITGRRFALEDIDGKLVKKGDSKALSDCAEGSSFESDMYSIELCNESSADEYKSGSLFINIASNSNSFAMPKVSKKVFSEHLGFQSERHETSVKESLVLHQDAFILNSKEITQGASAVFIDPYLNVKLRPHQREGVKFMFECVMGLRIQPFKGCLLADEMGLGKTLQVITLLWTIFQQLSRTNSQLRRAIVVCPSSLVQNWSNEVRKWLGIERLRAIVVHNGNAAKEVKQQFIDFSQSHVNPLLITSYELLRKYVDVVKSAKPGILVCDEAHRLKNCAGNKTIDALLMLDCPRRILLTGTPIQNDLNEFYAMMEFANPNLLGPLSTFKRLYTDPIERSHDRSASLAEKGIGQARSLDLQKRTEFCILRRNASINNKYLPSKTEYIVFCKPEKPQISLYLEILKSKIVSQAVDLNGSVTNVLLAICMLRKLCNHPTFVESSFSEIRETVKINGFQGFISDDPVENQKQVIKYSFKPEDISKSGKLHCLDLLLSSLLNVSSDKDRVVIVSNFTQNLDMIQGLCNHRCWKCFRLDGKTEITARQLLVDRFNKGFGEELIFLLSSKAGGTGLNLIGANRLILFDPDWNPATDAQAMARIWREGQQKSVTIYRFLTTGSIEEKIFQRQIMKCEVATTIEEEGHSKISRKGKQSFSRDELKELFSLHLDTSCNTYDLVSQAKVSGIDDWKNDSEEVEDFALKDVLKSDIVSFVHKAILC